MTVNSDIVKVKLISITPDAEKTIMYCARVSNPLNQSSVNYKLLDYCIKHNHWSIFEMANMVVEIKTTRAISAQILRHRSFSFQEFSQRYAEVAKVYFTHPRRQDDKNRQNSIDDLSRDDQRWFKIAESQINSLTISTYNEAIKRGIAKESARFLLPMSSGTIVYMNGTIRSWLHYIDLRTTEGTQKEHRDLALEIKNIFIKQLPTIAAAKGWKIEE